jgi:hypothetical protein
MLVREAAVSARLPGGFRAYQQPYDLISANLACAVRIHDI